MKIVDVSAFYAPRGGGVRTYVEHKITAAARAGHELVVVAPAAHDGVETRRCGARIIYVPSPAMPLDSRYHYFVDATAVHSILDAERPDLIEASSPWRTASIVASWRGAAKRALIMHADPLAAYAYRWLGGLLDRATIDRQFGWFWNHLRRNARHFDMVVCANDQLSQRLRAGDVPRVRTIRMGVDAGIFSPQRRDEALRAEMLSRCGFGPDATLLLGVGRHSAEKRWPMIVDAVRRANHNRPIGLVLVGEGRDTVRLQRHIGTDPHIHLLEPIRDRAALATVMASADALIHGCEAETFGLVAAEAAASGLPLIVPDEGGAADLAGLGCSILFKAGNARSAAVAIGRMADIEPAPLRAAALRHAATIGTMDDHFHALFAAYASADIVDDLAA